MNLVAGELEKLLKSVADRYEGMPVALSGGIDSSVLAAFIKPKFAISVELPGGERYNEIEWSKKVCEHLGIEHVIVQVDESKWDEYMPIAIKAIGRPIPHFNIFPLFCMYKKLSEMGVKEVVLGDGPDEVMCGYGRDLIINYLYKVYDFEAFKNYKPLIDKILPPLSETIERITGIKGDTVQEVDIKMRADMDDMSNGIANYFGIVNHRPYQDTYEIDGFMMDLPIEEKIHDVEFGKYPLRLIAEKYLPKEIAWRKNKVGGPLYSPNKKMGWYEKEGEFGKEGWVEYQKKCLKK